MTSNIPAWEFLVPKIIFSQTGSDSQKSEKLRFRLRYRFETRLLGANHTPYRFCTQKDPKPNQKCTKKREKHRFLEKKNNSARYDAVIASRLRLDR